MLPFRQLADRFTVVFYDHRCNGRSVGTPVTSMTWENLTADADALQRLGFHCWPSFEARKELLSRRSLVGVAPKAVKRMPVAAQIARSAAGVNAHVCVTERPGWPT